jgi:hypothetical protein
LEPGGAEMTTIYKYMLLPHSAKDISMKFCRIFAVADFMPTDLERLAMLISVFSHFIKRPIITTSGSSKSHTKKIKNKSKAFRICERKKNLLLNPNCLW